MTLMCLIPLTLLACNIEDDIGNSLNFSKPAQRIISLAPDITEILFAIGAGPQLVGVISGSDYPAEALTLPIVGTYAGLDLERIIQLKPDLIITWDSTNPHTLAALKKFSIPIYTTHPQQLNDVVRTIKNLGCLTGHEKKSIEIASQFQTKLAKLKKKYQQTTKVNVFYQIDTYALITINKQSWINQVIELCGGKNIFADAKLIAPRVDWESIVVRNPDVVLNSTNSNTWQSYWQSKKMNVVKNNFLFNVNPDLIDRAGPRLPEGAEYICQKLDGVRKLSFQHGLESSGSA